MEIIYDKERRLVIIDGIEYTSTFAIPDIVHNHLGATLWIDIVSFFNQLFKEDNYEQVE